MNATANLLLAAAPSGEGAKAGPWGLATILLLCVACYFLFKSMSKHLRKVREEFPTDDVAPTTPTTPTAPATPATPTAPSATPAIAPAESDDEAGDAEPAPPSLVKAEAQPEETGPPKDDAAP